MNLSCFLCEAAGAPVQAIGLLDGKPVCQFHVSSISPPPEPLPKPTESPEKGKTPMRPSKQFDVEAMKTEHAAGISFIDLGKKYGCAASTVRRHVLNGTKAAAHPAKREQPRANGHAVSEPADGLAELSAFLDHHWKRLPLAAKVRLLVNAAQQ